MWSKSDSCLSLWPNLVTYAISLIFNPFYLSNFLNFSLNSICLNFSQVMVCTSSHWAGCDTRSISKWNTDDLAAHLAGAVEYTGCISAEVVNPIPTTNKCPGYGIKPSDGVTYWPSTKSSIKRCTYVNKQKNSETGASSLRYRNITLTCRHGWIRCRCVHPQEAGGHETII